MRKEIRKGKGDLCVLCEEDRSRNGFRELRKEQGLGSVEIAEEKEEQEGEDGEGFVR